MRIGIATDHGGFELKGKLLAKLRDEGHVVVDFGAYALNPGDDYPDFVIPLAQARGCRKGGSRSGYLRQRCRGVGLR